MTLPQKLWSAVGIVTALNAVIAHLIATFIREIGYGGKCGTWAVTLHAEMIVLAIIALPAAHSMARFYYFSRGSLHPFARAYVRLSLCCLLALLAAYFIGFPLLSSVL